MNQGSHKIETEEDKRELEETFGVRYERIQTGVNGIHPLNRKQRREAIRRMRRSAARA